MSNQLLQKIAEELKNARKKKKISIDQIFTKTRIDKKYLNAIEEGNFSIMPEVYIRAFIKEYSKNVGLNPDEILEKYTLAKKGIDFEEYKNENEDSEVTKQLPGRKKKVILEKTDGDLKKESFEPNQQQHSKFNKSYYYAITAVLLLVFILVIYKLFLTETNNEIITEKPFEEIVKSQNANNSTSPNTLAEEDNTVQEIGKIEPKKVELIQTDSKENKTIPVTLQNAVNNTDNLVLSIVSSDKSWIRVESDDKDVMEFTIEEGVTKVLGAKDKFYLHIGNSGGIKLLLNNKDLLFSGSQGKVRKIFVTKNGIEYLRRTPTENAE